VTEVSNRILAALPSESRHALTPLLSRRNVDQGDVLYPVGAPIEHLYFMESGLVALVKPMHDGRSAEVGAIGREGIITPTGVFGGSRTVMEFVVEIPGSVLRISYDDFRDRLHIDAAFAEMMQRYAGLVMSQVTQTAACNILHSIEERCSRWLLIAHDNAFSDSFPITHEFLATLLGVRRASVQVAAAALQKEGAIAYSRGAVSITYRALLERSACECYGTIQGQIEDLFAR
jgi:CRP-like cAMP-binding protein